MVSIQSDRRPSKQSSVSPYFLVVLVLVFTVLFTFTSSNEIFALNPSVSRENTAIQDALSLDLEAQTMRTWRQQLETSCQQFLRSIPSNNISQAHLVHKALLESQALQRMVIPDLETSVHKTKTKPDYKFCSHVFLDLGTNRGDSISCAIDASLDVCSAHFVEKDPTIRPAYRLSLDFPRFHFNSTDLRVHASGSQGLSLLRLLQHFFERPGMESVCVYGIEGNPYFTKKLQAMVQVINAIRPRPLKYLHIDTETVVHSVDGPTALYIDQFSEKNHFWGSSVLPSMRDVRRSQRENNGTLIKANVDGVSLSTLLQKTLKPFQPGVEHAFQTGGSLLVKMDIEGAEFGVLKELATSRVLCNYIRMGNNATLVIEFHQHLIKNPDDKDKAIAGLKDAKEQLRKCGVKFRNLPNFWTR